MPSTTTIHFLQHHEIDKEKWDTCIDSSTNKLIYAYSFYLDAMAAGWKALVGNNYEWVLPLPWKSKYGIKYLHQPPFTQQLGVFYRQNIVVPYPEILKIMQQHFSFCEVYWNHQTPFLSSSIACTSATNFLLPLNKPYEILAAQFSTSLQQSIKRSCKFNLTYQAPIDYHQCIQTSLQKYGSRVPHVTRADYKNFENLCAYAFSHDMLRCREVLNAKGEMLANALLLFDGHRLYNMMNTTTDSGRKLDANYFLYHHMLKEFSSKEYLFDFEGSDLPGVKSFYEKFRPVHQPYFFIRYNNLPWPLRWLKR